MTHREMYAKQPHRFFSNGCRRGSYPVCMIAQFCHYLLSQDLVLLKTARQFHRIQHIWVVIDLLLQPREEATILCTHPFAQSRSFLLCVRDMAEFASRAMVATSLAREIRTRSTEDCSAPTVEEGTDGRSFIPRLWNALRVGVNDLLGGTARLRQLRLEGRLPTKLFLCGPRHPQAVAVVALAHPAIENAKAFIAVPA